MVLAVEDCVQFREEVQTTLDDLVQGQKEAQAEVTKILDSPTVREAQQLLLTHQVRSVLILTFSFWLFEKQISRSVNSHFQCVLFPKAIVKAPEAEKKGCPATDHQRPAAPGRGGFGRDSAAGPAEFREHNQQNGAEYGFTGAKP